MAYAFFKAEQSINLFLPTEDSALERNEVLMRGCKHLFPDLNPVAALKQQLLVKNRTKKQLSRSTMVARHSIFTQGRVHTVINYAIVSSNRCFVPSRRDWFTLQHYKFWNRSWYILLLFVATIMNIKLDGYTWSFDNACVVSRMMVLGKGYADETNIITRLLQNESLRLRSRNRSTW